MEKNDDILASFEIGETLQAEEDTEVKTHEDLSYVSNKQELEDKIIPEKSEESEKISYSEVQSTKKGFLYRALGSFIFLIKYLTTSACIFGVLLIAANYSAYYNIAHSFLYAEELERTKNSLIESVAAASIQESSSEEENEEVDTFKQLKSNNKKLEYAPSIHSLSNIIKKTQEDGIDLGIEITPYENRIVIPKIGKNIPLIDIKQQQVDGIDELNNIFMDELENGVIRYPGSGIPGEDGNAFIFGHSSNFPWMEGEYNDVFALLDKVVFDDEVVVYYGQEKYTYKIRSKNVISPGDVSVLKDNTIDDRSQVTLMTCWPIGTTLNRLVLVGDLIAVE